MALTAGSSGRPYTGESKSSASTRSPQTRRRHSEMFGQIAGVPSAAVQWPWAGEALLLGGVLLAVLATTAVVTALHVGRSDPAQLRSGDL